MQDFLLAGTESLEQQIKNNWSEKEIRKSWASGLKSLKNEKKIFNLPLALYFIPRYLCI